MILLQTTDPLAGIDINFSTNMVWVMNLCVAIIMFSVALSMKKEDFFMLAKSPKQVLVGLSSQLFLLPFLSFCLVMLVQPYAGLALGMILVGSLPGGNSSNYFTLVGRGNPALSVSMTAIASLLAPIFTPLNFSFWGSRVPYAAELFRSIELSFWDMAKSVLLMLVIPMILGIYFAKHFPAVTNKIKGGMQGLSLVILISFIVFAFSGNISIFVQYYDQIVYLVLLHTCVAFSAGYYWGYLFTRDKTVARTISIETGIQNSGLGLVLIFTLFQGQGGMALITAWWGIYDIFAGLTVAYIFRWWVARQELGASKIAN
jgi:BASS family bile acid:Na+ symporter